MKAGSNRFLDTSIVIDIFRNNATIKTKLQNVQFSLSVVVVAELLFGAENSANSQRHKQQVSRFIDFCPVAEINLQTALHYSKIKAQLRKTGKPIPENDIWIAASCIENNALLMSKDSHFSFIQGLNLELI